MPLLNFKQQGQGSHIILIHGLFGSLDNLAMVAKSLEENYSVTSVDVRNHGSSFHQMNMSYDELAVDIINLMNYLNIESALLLGHSMGGKIAMQVALQNPKRVNKLIVADIAPVQYPNHHKKIIEGLTEISATALTSRKQANDVLSNYVETPAIRQFLLKNLAIHEGKLTYKCNIENIALGYPDIMSKIEHPQPYLSDTLFIKGGNSDYITAEHRDAIIQLFPNAKVKIIQNTGHWLHAEKTVLFNRIVNNFIKAR